MDAKDSKLLHGYNEDWSGCADAKADLSSLGNHIEKIHCFFIPDNKWAVFINAWKVIMKCAGQDLLHHRTHPTHDTRHHSHSRSQPIERSMCTALRGSADRRGQKVRTLSQARCLTRFSNDLRPFLSLITLTISTRETGLYLLLTTVALKYVLKTISHRMQSTEQNYLYLRQHFFQNINI